MSNAPPELLLGHCDACGTWSFPAQAWGCRRCGRPTLQARPLPAPPRLVNAITVHIELVPGLPAPCVIGEVQLAPGVVEEALIDVASEDRLQAGMALQARAGADTQGRLRWVFAPADGVAA